jgi:hypothetical protein
MGAGSPGTNPTLSDSHTPIVTTLIAYFSERTSAAKPDRSGVLDWRVPTCDQPALTARLRVQSGATCHVIRCHLRAGARLYRAQKVQPAFPSIAADRSDGWLLDVHKRHRNRTGVAVIPDTRSGLPSKHRRWRRRVHHGHDHGPAVCLASSVRPGFTPARASGTECRVRPG